MVCSHNYQNSGHYYCPVFHLEPNVSETGFCFRLQVEPTQVGSIERASLYPDHRQVSPEDGNRIQSPKRVLNKRQDDG
jgi:hypothetical protein